MEYKNKKGRNENWQELAKIQKEKDELLEEFNSTMHYEQERESDLDYLYQKTIVDDDTYERENSLELYEIREEQKKTFYRIQEEREDFYSRIRKETKDKLDELERKIDFLKGENEDGNRFISRPGSSKETM